MENRIAMDGKFWAGFFAGLMLLFSCGLQGCKSNQMDDEPRRASRVAAENPAAGLDASSAGQPSGTAAENAPSAAALDTPSGNIPAPPQAGPSANPSLTIPSLPHSPRNAWGGAPSGLDMEVFGPGGTVVFRSHAYPLGDSPKEDAQGRTETE